MDPLTSAPQAAMALEVDPREFRALDENARLLRPLMGRGFQLWKLQERPARNGKARREWRLEARLGPHASGVYPQRVFDLGATPPGIRKAGFGEVMEVLRGPGRAGYPPSVPTDAQLGFSVAAYQLAEMLVERCEGDGRVLVRIIGARAQAHKGSEEGDMTQRAKVGCSPCCARPTNVAAPPLYLVGEYLSRKAHGVELRK